MRPDNDYKVIELLLNDVTPEELPNILINFIKEQGTQIDQNQIKEIFRSIKHKFKEESNKLLLAIKLEIENQNKKSIEKFKNFVKTVILNSDEKLLQTSDHSIKLDLLDSINQIYKNIDKLEEKEVYWVFEAHLNVILSLHKAQELNDPDILLHFAKTIYPSLTENDKERFLTIILDKGAFNYGFAKFYQDQENMNIEEKIPQSSSIILNNTSTRLSEKRCEIMVELNIQAEEHNIETWRDPQNLPPSNSFDSDQSIPDNLTRATSIPSIPSNLTTFASFNTTLSDHGFKPVYKAEPWDEISKNRVKGNIMHLTDKSYSAAFSEFKDFILDSDYWKSKHKGISLKWTQIPDGIQALQDKIHEKNRIHFSELKICITDYCKSVGNYRFFSKRRDQSITQPFYNLLIRANNFDEIYNSEIYKGFLKDRRAFYREKEENQTLILKNPGIH